MNHDETAILLHYRSVSILCIGNQNMHTELRVRAACELVLNSEYYLQPHIISLLNNDGIIKSKNVIPVTSRCYNTAQAHAKSASIDRENIPLLCFKEDCMETTKHNSWSNMWHVHALASVIKHPIQSIYPEYNNRIRPVFNKLVIPRESQEPAITCNNKFVVMWTRVQPAAVSRTDTTWSPNHFVPCIPVRPTACAKQQSPRTKPEVSSMPATLPGKRCREYTPDESTNICKILRIGGYQLQTAHKGLMIKPKNQTSLTLLANKGKKEKQITREVVNEDNSMKASIRTDVHVQGSTRSFCQASQKSSIVSIASAIPISTILSLQAIDRIMPSEVAPTCDTDTLSLNNYFCPNSASSQPSPQPVSAVSAVPMISSMIPAPLIMTLPSK